MPRYALTDRARRDLAAIYADTEDQWGERQARRYLADLMAAVERLVDFPEIGVARPELQRGLRSWIAAEHIILYLPAGRRSADGHRRRAPALGLSGFLPLGFAPDRP